MNHAEPHGPLGDYVRAKHEVAALLRDAWEYAKETAPWAAEGVHELIARLGESRFRLVVVGQFKRGKSSLMNAIIGQSLLPTGLLPVTSAITSLSYGSRPRVVIRRAGRAIDEEVLIERLPSFITEQGNPGNRERVLSAEVEVPAPFLRRGLTFVDTPGIGSARAANTATTLSFLPEADAALFVTSADGPLSEAEMGFLDAVRQHVRKLFFVVNKVDLVASAERAGLADYVHATLRRHLGSQPLRVFLCSASGALEHIASDGGPSHASGVTKLVSALAAFLDSEGRTVLLVGVLDRLAARLEEIRFMRGMRRDVAARAAEEPGAYADLRRRLDALERERRDLVHALEQRVGTWAATELAPDLERFAERTSASLLAVLQDPNAPSVADADGQHPVQASWLTRRLEGEASAWLRRNAGMVDLLGRSMVEREGVAMEGILAKPRAVAVATLAAAGHGACGAEAQAPSFQWSPPPFEPQPLGPVGVASEAGGDSMRLLPRPLMAWRLRRSRIRHLPTDASRAAAKIREHVVRHVRSCVRDFDVRSQQALERERGRIEEALVPAAAARRPPDRRRKGSALDGSAPPGDVSAGDEEVLEHLQSRAAALREALLEGGSVDAAAAARPSATQSGTSASSPATPAPESESSPTPAATRRTNAPGTCPVCAAAAHGVFDFLAHHQYAIGRDVATQQAFVATLGLCPTHTWHLERLSSPRGLSLGYPALLDHVERSLRASARGPLDVAVHRLDDLTTARHTCPACVARGRAEQAAAGRFLRGLDTGQGRTTFERSGWVCLRHLRLVLASANEETSAFLLRVEARRAGEISESMREFVIKHDARRRELMTNEERRAWRDALVLLVGERYLFRTEQEE
jgi:GTP-binding protein EngB required for normal cell division